MVTLGLGPEEMAKMICELSYRLDKFEKHTSGRKFVFFDKVLLLIHDMGLPLEFIATIF